MGCNTSSLLPEGFIKFHYAASQKRAQEGSPKVAGEIAPPCGKKKIPPLRSARFASFVVFAVNLFSFSRLELFQVVLFY
jgi:hypothetical protein